MNRPRATYWYVWCSGVVGIAMVGVGLALIDLPLDAAATVTCIAALAGGAGHHFFGATSAGEAVGGDLRAAAVGAVAGLALAGILDADGRVGVEVVLLLAASSPPALRWYVTPSLAPFVALALVEARSGYLDELQRRDPIGFDRWMTNGPRAASDPGRYLKLPPANEYGQNL